MKSKLTFLVVLVIIFGINPANIFAEDGAGKEERPSSEFKKAESLGKGIEPDRSVEILSTTDKKQISKKESSESLSDVLKNYEVSAEKISAIDIKIGD